MNLKSSPGPVKRSIGEVAAQFGLATHVLRHWEDMGLLAPERVGGRRLYGEADIARVTMILRGKQAGLSLAQIGELLSTPRERHLDLLVGYRAHMEQQIARIEAAKAMIDHIIDCHADDFTECAEFHAVARAAAPRPARTA